jgi:ribosomal protein S18 acetylase RimI-like enzyme
MVVDGQVPGTLLEIADMRIRPLDTTHDFPALASLLAERDPEPPTPELLQEWEVNAPEQLVRQRLVAFADVGTDALVGFCDAASWPWERPHQFWLSTVVAPDHRRHGLGVQLTESALAFAHERGATRLVAEVRDNVPEGLGFAARYGFRRGRHIFESRLHLASFVDLPLGAR